MESQHISGINSMDLICKKLLKLILSDYFDPMLMWWTGGGSGSALTPPRTEVGAACIEQKTDQI